MVRYSYLFFISLCTAQVDLDSAARMIVHNELMFSHTSVVKGRNQAFIEFFSDSSVTFNPLPVNAKELYKKLPEHKGYLIWKPTCVEISSSGDFGYSTGPWEIRKGSLGNEPVAVGHYFSLWKKEDKNWKVILDTGIDYEVKKSRKETLKILHPSSSAIKLSNWKQSLLESQRLFFSVAAKQTIAEAHKEFASTNVRVYRNKHFPTSGKMESTDLLTHDGTTYRFHVMGSQLSSANDLGYVYGIAVSQKSDTSVFVHVWRLEDRWKLAVDFLSAIR